MDSRTHDARENNIVTAKSLKMGHDYWDATLSNLKIKNEYLEPISKWLKNPQYMLVLCGDTGTGKTHLSAAIINDDWGKKESFKYLREVNIHTISMAAVHKNWDGMKEIIDKCSSKYLIIDDLGTGMVNEYRSQCIEELIDYRYSNGQIMQTVVTTNLFPEDVYERYSPRVHSRIFSKRNLILILEEEDLRLT